MLISKLSKKDVTFIGILSLFQGTYSCEENNSRRVVYIILIYSTYVRDLDLEFLKQLINTHITRNHLGSTDTNSC